MYILVGQSPDMKKMYNLIPWLVTLLLVLWILFTKSPFQEKEVSDAYLIYIVVFVMLIANLIAIRYRKSDILERLVIAIVFAVLSLLLISLYVMPPILTSMYGANFWDFEETKDRIIVNTIYYGLIALDLIVSFWVYFKFNLIGRKKRTQQPSIPS